MLTYEEDVEAGASYLRIRDGEVDRTVEVGRHLVDLDRANNPLGFETIEKSRCPLSRADINKALAAQGSAPTQADTEYRSLLSRVKSDIGPDFALDLDEAVGQRLIEAEAKVVDLVTARRFPTDNDK